MLGSYEILNKNTNFLRAWEVSVADVLVSGLSEGYIQINNPALFCKRDPPSFAFQSLYSLFTITMFDIEKKMNRVTA